MRRNGPLVAGLVTVLLALLLILLAIPLTVVTSYIPSWAASHKLVWIQNPGAFRPAAESGQQFCLVGRGDY